eukprot:TRINITY_DN5055_c0_g1_i1.p1 TRINITY_DN5055_c0_g1~~TRINITY_DN5055_c0_g1_i1.p1  ORF type:complete len:503 (+),score=96.04 TRINITY_DN5055_c0_g1_i1:1-1509(+)
MAPDVCMATFRGVKILFNELVIYEEIGEGAFAVVYKGLWKDQIVAVKRLQVKMISPPDNDVCKGDRDLQEQRNQQQRILEVFSEFRQEVALLSTLKHKNIVELKGIVLEPFCLVMEYMELGNLHDYLQEPINKVDWSTRISVALGTAEALHFLHGESLIHRDIKSPNILLGKEYTLEGSELIVSKVSDFGLSRKLLLAPQLKNRVVDNPRWLAPEIISNRNYTEKADIYSFGIILYELLCRKEPYEELDFLWEVQEAVIKGTKPNIPPEIEQANYNPALYPTFHGLIKECWDSTPESRPTSAKIVKTMKTLAASVGQLYSTSSTDVINSMELLDKSSSVEMTNSEEEGSSAIRAGFQSPAPATSAIMRATTSIPTQNVNSTLSSISTSSISNPNVVGVTSSSTIDKALPISHTLMNNNTRNLSGDWPGMGSSPEESDESDGNQTHQSSSHGLSSSAASSPTSKDNPPPGSLTMRTNMNKKTSRSISSVVKDLSTHLDGLGDM